MERDNRGTRQANIFKGESNIFSAVYLSWKYFPQTLWGENKLKVSVSFGRFPIFHVVFISLILPRPREQNRTGDRHRKVGEIVSVVEVQGRLKKGTPKYNKMTIPPSLLFVVKFSSRRSVFIFLGITKQHHCRAEILE